MQNFDFKKDLEFSISTLKNGGSILYPTDTVWGIGCDATNEKAVQNIFAVKKRVESKSMIVLLDDEKKLGDYVRNIPGKFPEIIYQSARPLTVIFDDARNIASNLIAMDGSIAIRIVKDKFCKELIRKFGKPIVSTSANISRENTPKFFKDISPAIISSMDYVVKYRQDDENENFPSQIIRFRKNGEMEIIRK